jgi:hypothetical protein
MMHTIDMYFDLVCAPPTNQNLELQKHITDEESDSLHLCDMNLTDEDMKIVAYYAIRDKEVRLVILIWMFR